MRRVFLYILALLLMAALAACAEAPAGITDPASDTAASSSSEQKMDSAPENPGDSTSAPADDKADTPVPPVSGPEQEQPPLTMPGVGNDPGGFGPIF